MKVLVTGFDLATTVGIGKACDGTGAAPMPRPATSAEARIECFMVMLQLSLYGISSTARVLQELNSIIRRCSNADYCITDKLA